MMPATAAYVARNMSRYYRMVIWRDLFGQASLVREWGRIGSRGQMMVETHADEGLAGSAEGFSKIDHLRQPPGNE